MQDIPQPVANEQEILNYYKEHYKTKICNEITFEATMDEKGRPTKNSKAHAVA